jgi:predicted P-loop ATPase
MTAADLMICWAKTPSIHSAGWTPQEPITWQNLSMEFASHSLRASKDGELWAPVSVSATATRKNEDVFEVYALVLDFDSGVTPEEALDPIRFLGLAWIGHSSHSHSPDKPKFRIIVPLSRPVPRDNWRIIWTWASANIGIGADPACKNTNRVYYTPSCPPEKSEHIWSESEDGRALDVDWVMDQISQNEEAPRPRAPRPAGLGVGDYKSIDLFGWAQSNGARPVQEQDGERKVFVVCPWRETHTDGKQGPKDSYLFDKGDGWPIFKCSHGHCQGHGFKALLQAWPNADQFCAQTYTPPARISQSVSYSPELAVSLDRAINEITSCVEWNPTDKHGLPKQGVSNARIYLETQYEERMRYNEFARVVELDGKPVGDTEIAELIQEIEVASSVNKWGKNFVEAALAIICKKGHSYHPIREYLSDLEWDGVERLDKVATEAFTVANSQPIYSRYLQCFFISAVARILKPGCKVDTALILQGGQGVRKSSFFESLVAEDCWFSDDMGSVDDKDSKMAVAQCWIVEWGELESVRRSNTNAVKAFLSRRVDKFRPPYGRAIAEYPRQCVIAGSTNEDQFLQDSTGNRRFMVVPVEFIDTDWIRTNRDQLWAEAVRQYKDGVRWYLNEEERKIQNAANEELITQDPWLDRFESWAKPGVLPVSVGGKFEVTASHILAECFKLSHGLQTRAHENRLGSILRDCGWSRTRKRVDGQMRWVWTKIDDKQFPDTSW